jgi:hypothetical protein
MKKFNPLDKSRKTTQQLMLDTPSSQNEELIGSYIDSENKKQ